MNNNYYESLGMYINNTVGAFLAPNKDLKSISFKRHAVSTYIRLVDVFGNSYYYDVTAMDEDQVCKMICDIVATKPVAQQITDKDLKRKVAELFD